MREQHTEHPSWLAQATSHHSEVLLHKADWAVSQDTFPQNTLAGPGQAQLTVANSDGHLELRPPTIQTLWTVAQHVQLGHKSTHQGHAPLGTAHPTAYLHARDLIVAATNHPALRARERHTSVQLRLHTGVEQLPSVFVLPQPCLICGGRKETRVHMHVSCTHSCLLCPRYRQAVQEAARHLPPGDKALSVASWRSADAEWTEMFCSGLVHDAAEARLRTITRYDPPGGTSVDEFVLHMLRAGDFVFKLCNHWMEQLLRTPHSAATRLHRWLTGMERK